MPKTNHTPLRHYERRNLCHDQSSVELFWKTTTTTTTNKTARKYSKIDNSHFSQKTSNGPMCLANNYLWLPNMVSE